jgi:hypothetical protein
VFILSSVKNTALCWGSGSDGRHWNSHIVKYERPTPIFGRCLWERCPPNIFHFFITSHFVIFQLYFKVSAVLEDHPLSIVRQCLFSTLTSWEPLLPSETSECAMPWQKPEEYDNLQDLGSYKSRECECVDSIQLSQVMVQWRAHKIEHFGSCQVPWTEGNIIYSLVTISFSKRTITHGKLKM